ncbi:MAG: hypothetical protein HC810_08780 [Acaryochloridaceae cyanobacterium RL_2_7]|nr:hypothetical protein [Acaryochloridaceae cyanobacterium RL_2_7]
MAKKKSSGNYNNLWSGQKGGVGKSWCARLDAQRHVDRKIPFWLMDADRGNQSTLRFYPDYTYKKSVHFSEAEERSSSANPILEAAIEKPVVTNCRAGTNTQILTWIKSKKVAVMAKKLGVTLRYFFVSDLETDSLNLFEPTVQMFAPYMSVIFVANRGRNLSGDSFFKTDGFQSLLKSFKFQSLM